MAKPKGNWFDSMFHPEQKASERRSLEIGRARGKECPYCGDPMRRPSRDHVVPKSKGHTFVRNKLVCCYECNQLKANRSLVQWLIVLATKTDPKNIERARRVNNLIRERHRAGLKIDHLDDLTSTTY